MLHAEVNFECYAYTLSDMVMDYDIFDIHIHIYIQYIHIYIGFF